jgi:hypothetical protein
MKKRKRFVGLVVAFLVAMIYVFRGNNGQVLALPADVIRAEVQISCVTDSESEGLKAVVSGWKSLSPDIVTQFFSELQLVKKASKAATVRQSADSIDFKLTLRTGEVSRAVLYYFRPGNDKILLYFPASDQWPDAAELRQGNTQCFEYLNPHLDGEVVPLYWYQ